MRAAERRLRGAQRLGLALLAVVLVLSADVVLYPSLARLGGRSGDKGRNGLWLRYTWYFGEHSDAEVRELARSSRARHIRYAYFHVRYVTREGRLRFREPESARRLVKVLRREAPDVQAIAWVYAGNSRGKGEVDLADPEVRRAMVAEAVWLVTECGFGGVQWDYEVCPDGDPDFVRLLQETREAMPPGKLLACAAPVWAPWPLTKRWGWSEGYFAEVARTCDQIAVMGYDTGLYVPRAYVWLMRQQAIRVTRSVGTANPDCGVVLGLPTYESILPAHNAWSENVRLALKGVREGLGNPACDTSAFEGVALFADYTTDGDEWDT
jgi:hypothetical protein